MPQLDRFAYVSEAIWLIAVFLGLYFLLLKTGLPRLYKVLKFRRNKLMGVRESVISLEQEVYLLEKCLKTLTTTFIKNLKVLPEQVNKVIDTSVEGKRSVFRANLEKEQEFFSGFRGKESSEKDLRVSKLLDEVIFITDKGNLKKKVFNR